MLPLPEVGKSWEKLIQGDMCAQVTTEMPIIHPSGEGQWAALSLEFRGKFTVKGIH